ncbi:MAG: gliding motility-associated C-terminal domain-containing protein [Bacteroidetes bacterium]|nr:gliding motility-associated C-terminal domain-containing protein [Bacteroidota bacterium]
MRKLYIYHYANKWNRAVAGTWLLNENINPVVSNGASNSWIINNVATTETYVYSVKDKCNFVDTDTITVLAIDCDLVIPNIVTSNGDNINDVFFIKNLHKNPGTSVKIFDRWGVKMYEATNYQNNWKPNELSDGVYYYIVESVKRGKFNGFLHVLNNK